MIQIYQAKEEDREKIKNFHIKNHLEETVNYPGELESQEKDL